MPEKVTRKTGLGRGLGSLLGATDSEYGLPNSMNFKEKGKTKEARDAQPQIPEHQRIWNLNINQIRRNVEQPRQAFAEESLEELAKSIKEKGILQPITVRKCSEDEFEIVAGERRFRAAQMAGHVEVPAIIIEANDQQALELALIENIQRSDLNPMEEAEAYEQLMNEYGLTQAQVADRVGKMRATVANVLRLLHLPEIVRNYVRKGQLTLGQAKALMSLEDQKAMEKLAERAVQGNLTVRKIESLVHQHKLKFNESSQHQEGSASILPPEVQAVHELARSLQQTLGTKVTIDYSAGKGKLTVHFYSSDELNKLVERIQR